MHNVCLNTICLNSLIGHSVVNLFSKYYLLLSLKGDILEDPANEPKEDMYMMSTSPEAAPEKPE
jgi:hypothetical protein